MTNADVADPADLRASADSVLARLVSDTTGTARLREDQWRAIEALVADKRRALVVQRTGWGKSAVYFVATSLLRERGSGPTVIVSPLLALMRNQVEAAARAGIRARTINSSNTEEWDTVQAEVAAGEVDVLLVSPEALSSPHWRSASCSVGSAAGWSTRSGCSAQTVQGDVCSRQPRGTASHPPRSRLAPAGRGGPQGRGSAEQRGEISPGGPVRTL